MVTTQGNKQDKTLQFCFLEVFANQFAKLNFPIIYNTLRYLLVVFPFCFAATSYTWLGYVVLLCELGGRTGPWVRQRQQLGAVAPWLSAAARDGSAQRLALAQQPFSRDDSTWP